MEPILCYECGHPVSDKWDAFLLMKKILLKKQSEGVKTADDKKSLDPELNQSLKPIFEALYIESLCTRKIFLTSKNIHNF